MKPTICNKLNFLEIIISSTWLLLSMSRNWNPDLVITGALFWVSSRDISPAYRAIYDNIRPAFCSKTFFKGTASVGSRDPQCKDGNPLFKTVPLKPLSDQNCGRYCNFSSFKRVLGLIIPLCFPAVEMRKSLLKTWISNRMDIS